MTLGEKAGGLCGGFVGRGGVVASFLTAGVEASTATCVVRGTLPVELRRAGSLFLVIVVGFV